MRGYGNIQGGRNDEVFSNDYAFFVRDAIMEILRKWKSQSKVTGKIDREMELFNEVKNSKAHLVDLMDSTIQNDERIQNWIV